MPNEMSNEVSYEEAAKTARKKIEWEAKKEMFRDLLDKIDFSTIEYVSIGEYGDDVFRIEFK